jgi:hypothetical protein
MRPNTKARNRNIAWPDKRQWHSKFESRLVADQQALAAYGKLKRGGCMVGNILSFLYAYTFSPSTVFPDYSRRRAVALESLKAISARLDGAAEAMTKLLDTPWRSQPTFAAFLRECTFDGPASGTGGSIKCNESPLPIALNLPSTLKSYSIHLEHLRKELQKKMSARKVGKAFYLAEFATYIGLLKGESIPWNVLAELVNAARPENWKETDVNASLLKKNFSSFTRRNAELYRLIRADTAEYLATCAQLPENERPTYVRWTLDRQARHEGPR